MTERRLAPLNALSTLARRPRADGRSLARKPAGPPSAPGQSRLIDNAVYSAGRRVATPPTVAESRQELIEGAERLAWIGLSRPEPREAGECAELFALPESARGDGLQAPRA